MTETKYRVQFHLMLFLSVLLFTLTYSVTGANLRIDDFYLTDPDTNVIARKYIVEDVTYDPCVKISGENTDYEGRGFCVHRTSSMPNGWSGTEYYDLPKKIMQSENPRLIGFPVCDSLRAKSVGPRDFSFKLCQYWCGFTCGCECKSSGSHAFLYESPKYELFVLPKDGYEPNLEIALQPDVLTGIEGEEKSITVIIKNRAKDLNIGQPDAPALDVRVEVQIGGKSYYPEASVDEILEQQERTISASVRLPDSTVTSGRIVVTYRDARQPRSLDKAFTIKSLCDGVLCGSICRKDKGRCCNDAWYPDEGLRAACCSDDDCDGYCEKHFCEAPKGIGHSCSGYSECISNNCQNGICCESGKACCSSDRNCGEKEICDTAQSHCVPWEEPLDFFLEYWELAAAFGLLSLIAYYLHVHKRKTLGGEDVKVRRRLTREGGHGEDDVGKPAAAAGSIVRPARIPVPPPPRKKAVPIIPPPPPPARKKAVSPIPPPSPSSPPEPQAALGKGVHVKRGYERAGEWIKLGVKVVNNTDFIINKVNVQVDDFPSALQYEQTGKSPMMKLQTINPGEFQSAIFRFKPTRCVDGKLTGFVRYTDAKGKKHTLDIKPIEVKSVCPMLTGENVNYAEIVDRLMHETLTCNKLFIEFQGNVRSVYDVVQARLGRLILYDHDWNTSGSAYIGYLCYLGKTKFAKKYFAAEFLISGTSEDKGGITISVYSDEPAILTGFFHEIVTDLKNHITVLKETSGVCGVGCGKCGGPLDITKVIEGGYVQCEHCDFWNRIPKWKR